MPKVGKTRARRKETGGILRKRTGALRTAVLRSGHADLNPESWARNWGKLRNVPGRYPILSLIKAVVS
jgi:hypothetical protein